MAQYEGIFTFYLYLFLIDALCCFRAKGNPSIELPDVHFQFFFYCIKRMYILLLVSQWLAFVETKRNAIISKHFLHKLLISVRVWQQKWDVSALIQQTSVINPSSSPEAGFSSVFNILRFSGFITDTHVLKVSHVIHGYMWHMLHSNTSELDRDIMLNKLFFTRQWKDQVVKYLTTAPFISRVSDQTHVRSSHAFGFLSVH